MSLHIEADMAATLMQVIGAIITAGWHLWVALRISIVAKPNPYFLQANRRCKCSEYFRLRPILTPLNYRILHWLHWQSCFTITFWPSETRYPCSSPRVLELKNNCTRWNISGKRKSLFVRCVPNQILTRQPFSISVSLLYLMNRYFTPIGVILSVYAIFSPTWTHKVSDTYTVQL